MDQQEFEQLWPDRDGLSQDLRGRLEAAARTQSHARAFTQGGATVRDLLLNLEEVKAPANFAYRMGIYARNHSEPTRSVVERTWFRWTAVSTGLVSGAFLMMLLLGNPGALHQPGLSTPSSQLVQPTPLQEGNPAPVVADERLAAVADSTAARNDSAGPRANHPVPHYDLQRVSTSE